MFKCEGACKQTHPEQPKPIFVITGIRRVQYRKARNWDRKSSLGWEIAEEKKMCKSCAAGASEAQVVAEKIVNQPWVRPAFKRRESSMEER